MKEWGYNKNFKPEEMKYMVDEREKRKLEEGKDTTFFHHGIPIPDQRFDNSKRRKTDEISRAAGEFFCT
jgi:hypothetical protein